MLFQKQIEPRCAYCQRGAPLDDSQIICVKKGIVDPGDRCASFRYDPLKRVPARHRPLDFSQYTDRDFTL